MLGTIPLPTLPTMTKMIMIMQVAIVVKLVWMLMQMTELSSFTCPCTPLIIIREKRRPYMDRLYRDAASNLVRNQQRS